MCWKSGSHKKVQSDIDLVNCWFFVWQYKLRLATLLLLRVSSIPYLGLRQNDDCEQGVKWTTDFFGTSPNRKVDQNLDYTLSLLNVCSVKRGNKINFRCNFGQLLLNFKLVTLTFLSEIIWTFTSMNWCKSCPKSQRKFNLLSR